MSSTQETPARTTSGGPAAAAALTRAIEADQRRLQRLVTETEAAGLPGHTTRQVLAAIRGALTALDVAHDFAATAGVLPLPWQSRGEVRSLEAHRSRTNRPSAAEPPAGVR